VLQIILTIHHILNQLEDSLTLDLVIQVE